MSVITNGSEPLFLGVDGGGSKCRAVIVDSRGEIRGTGLGGPANPYQNFTQALDSVGHATAAALSAAGMAPHQAGQLHACLGLAGVNVPSVHDRLLAWTHPYADIDVRTDLYVACVGAHHGEEGAVIIAGTGSCGYAYVAGQETILGGHGFPVGDKGSGAWTGLEAVRHVLLALDGFASPSLLTERILAKLEVHDPISVVQILGERGVRGYAALAPLVFTTAREGDPVAEAIVREGAAYLSALARRLLDQKPPRLSMLGGLVPMLMPWLDPDVAGHVAPPLAPPEWGAAWLAQQRWQARQTA